MAQGGINLGGATAQQMTALLHERLADVASDLCRSAIPVGSMSSRCCAWRMVIVGPTDHRHGDREIEASDLAYDLELTRCQQSSARAVQPSLPVTSAVPGPLRAAKARGTM